MWYYYIYVMCDKIRDAEMECYEEEVSKRGKYEEDDEDEYEHAGLYRRGGRRGGMYGRRVYGNRYDVEREEYDKLFEKEREREYDPYTEYGRSRATRYVRY